MPPPAGVRLWCAHAHDCWRSGIRRPKPDQDLRDGRSDRAGAARHRLRSLSGRVRRPPRAVRIGQVDSPEHPGRPGRADERRRHLSGPQSDDRRRGGAHRLPAHPCRLRLPVLQSHPEPDRARERRARDRDRLEPDDAGGSARSRESRSSPRSLPRAALRRRAAACRDCARDRQAARRAVVRRADRRARHHDRRRGARGHRESEPRARYGDGGDHPQRGDRRDGRPHRPAG